MCMMSVLTGYGQTQVPGASWTPETWRQFRVVAENVDALDAALGEPECIDPGKDAWMQEMETRMQALEAATFRNSAFRGPIPE